MPERQVGYDGIVTIVQLRRDILRLRIAQFAFTIPAVTMSSSVPVRLPANEGDRCA